MEAEEEEGGREGGREEGCIVFLSVWEKRLGAEALRFCVC
jgi:hypothetical protein